MIQTDLVGQTVYVQVCNPPEARRGKTLEYNEHLRYMEWRPAVVRAVYLAGWWRRRPRAVVNLHGILADVDLVADVNTIDPTPVPVGPKYKGDPFANEPHLTIVREDPGHAPRE